MATSFAHLRNWERSRPIFPKNNLKSSDWAMQKKQPRFQASYENEDKIDMAKLLAMDYGRMWLIERENWGAKRIQVDHRAARHAQWVIKWKEIQRTYRQADRQRMENKQKNVRQNC